MERGYKFPEITSWIRANKKDFELVKDLGMKETGILVSCSDYHIFYKLKMTRREAMEHYLSVIRECLETGVSPRCHLEDITRSDIYGFVIPFCLELMHLMEEYQISLTQAVLGYLTCRDFTCLPLYGPRNIEDLKDAMETFSIPFLKEYYAD